MGKRTHDDGRPKGKVTAYVFFVRHQHEVNKDIKLPFSEFSKQCSRIWKDMTMAEKEPFQAQANADKERYEEELSVFKANGGVITNSNGKPTKKSRQEAKDPNLPKRPRAAFFLYSVAMRETVRGEHPGFKVTDVARELGRLWRGVDETTKAQYQAEADIEKEQYHQKMGVYRQNKQEEEKVKREAEQVKLAEERAAEQAQQAQQAQQQHQQLQQQQQQQQQQQSQQLQQPQHQQQYYQQYQYQEAEQEEDDQSSPAPGRQQYQYAYSQQTHQPTAGASQHQVSQNATTSQPQTTQYQYQQPVQYHVQQTTTNAQGQQTTQYIPIPAHQVQQLQQAGHQIHQLQTQNVQPQSNNQTSTSQQPVQVQQIQQIHVPQNNAAQTYQIINGNQLTYAYAKPVQQGQQQQPHVTTSSHSTQPQQPQQAGASYHVYQQPEGQ